MKKSRICRDGAVDFELDHLFLCVSEGGPEAEELTRLGLAEGPANAHPGQGTANRRFFFANAMLELLWVTNAAEAQGEPARPLQLWQRWSGRRGGACPFGICLRPSRPGVEGLPFPSRPYQPPFFPPDLSLHIAANTSAQEPLLFYIPSYRRADQQPSLMPYLQHPVGWRQITRVLLCGPHPPAPHALGPVDGIAFGADGHHRMEIGFDGESTEHCADLRPLLPLVLRW
jgi:hypothetical protein